MNGVIVKLRNVIYKADKLCHSAYIYEQSQRLAEYSGWDGNIKAVAAETLEEGVEKIRLQLLDWLSVRSKGFRDVIPESFRFEVSYSEMKDGEFWFQPTLSPCKEYEVVK